MSELKLKPPEWKPLRVRLLLWGFLLLLIGALWVLDRYNRGYTAWQILSEIPWFWLAAGVSTLLGLRWLVTRPLSPAMEQAFLQIEQEQAVCRHCGQPLKSQAITCSSCGNVVAWGDLIGCVIGVIVSLLILGALFAAG